MALPMSACPTCHRRDLDRKYRQFLAEVQRLQEHPEEAVGADPDLPITGRALDNIGLRHCIKCRMYMLSRTRQYSWPQVTVDLPATVRVLPPAKAEKGLKYLAR